jgi:UDP-N-acetylmuramoyl-L-alanyl-D-glutamate--2,6-diaminopimelate ligase
VRERFEEKLKQRRAQQCDLSSGALLSSAPEESTSVPEFSFLRPRHTRGVSLSTLTNKNVRLVGNHSGVVVTNVAVNGGELYAQGLFAAFAGENQHGASYYQQAVAAGAVAVITDPAGLEMLAGTSLPILVAENPRAELGHIAARVYGTDQQHPQLFGVTGTNGKTSTVHLLDAISEQVGIRAGHSSTADRRSGATTVPSRLTSPEAPELHAIVARMNEDAVGLAALEVSAQALRHHRTDGLIFDVSGFTNLSHEHMDEFKSMDNYLSAKLELFSPSRSRRGVILLDSYAGIEVRDRAQVPVTTVTSVPGADADWIVEVLEASPSSTRFALTGPGQQRLETSVPLIGRHMAADAALAIVMLVEGRIHFSQIASALVAGIEVDIPGRTKLVS